MLRNFSKLFGSFEKTLVRKNEKILFLFSMKNFSFFSTRQFSLFSKKKFIFPPKRTVEYFPGSISGFPSSSSKFNKSNFFESAHKLKITYKSTPNPDSLMFYPGVPVLGENKSTMNFPTKSSAKNSPLAQYLWRINGVIGVFLGPDYITVNKSEYEEWPGLSRAIMGTLLDFYSSGEKVIEEEISERDDLKIKEEDSEVVKMIKEILETRVRPAVQDDGGDLIFKGFDQGVVFVKMQGSCSGCPSSSVTLKNGIENMLKHWIPEVISVVALDDDDLSKINSEVFSNAEKKINSS